MSDSVRPHRWQPIKSPHPWDSPGKNTGVGCHFLLQCMKVKSESEVVQSCPTLSNPMDCGPPGPPSMGFSRQEYWSGVPLPSVSIFQIDSLTSLFRKCEHLLSLSLTLGHLPNSGTTGKVPFHTLSHTYFLYILCKWDHHLFIIW